MFYLINSVVVTIISLFQRIFYYLPRLFLSYPVPSASFRLEWVLVIQSRRSFPPFKTHNDYIKKYVTNTLDLLKNTGLIERVVSLYSIQHQPKWH